MMVLELWLHLKATSTLPKCIDIPDKNLWPVVVWYFEGKEYLFMDDNTPVHRAHTVENYKEQNEVTSTEWPAQ